MAESNQEFDSSRYKNSKDNGEVKGSKDNAKKKELSDIVASIKSKFKNNLPFSEVGSRVSVVVNPNQSLDLFSDAVSYDYIVQTLKQDAQRKFEDALPPHIFATAGNALRRVLDNNEDTSVIFLGDTGSGKTESSKLFIRQLTRLSRAVNQGSKKITSRIHYVDTLFDAFGAYTTHAQATRSLVARYTEVQYNESEIIGAKLITYLLNSRYITQRNAADRNVNVLHYLLAGCTREEVIQYRLDTGCNSPYVKISGGAQSHNEGHKSQVAADRIRFNELREHLKYLGFSRRAQSHIFRTLSLILHLGLLTFVDNSPDVIEGGDFYYCAVKNQAEIELVAELTGVDASNLNRALLTQTRQSKSKDIYTKFLTAKEAAVSRDNFVEALYNFLFSYIIEQVNKKICQDECLAFIGVVDFPGFESDQSLFQRKDDTYLKSMELYRLLKNYANEQLVNFMCERISSWNAEYKNDGIRSVSPSFTFQNPYLLLALAGGKSSFFSLIEKYVSDRKSRNAPMQEDVSQLNSIAAGIVKESLVSATEQAQNILGLNSQAKGTRAPTPLHNRNNMFDRYSNNSRSANQDTTTVAHHPRIDGSVITLVPGTQSPETDGDANAPDQNKSDKHQRQQKRRPISKKDTVPHQKQKYAHKNSEYDEVATKDPVIQSPVFLIKHYGDTKTAYTFCDLVEGTYSDIPPDLLTLIVGNEHTGIPPSANSFIRELVSGSHSNVNLQLGGRENKVITSVSKRNTPQRAPSVGRQTGNRTLKRSKSITGTWKKRNLDQSYSNHEISEFITSIVSLIETLNDTIPWFVICANTSSGSVSAKKFDAKLVENQLCRLGLIEIRDSLKSADYGVVYTMNEFLERYQVLISIQKFDESSGPAGLCEDFVLAYNWTRCDMNVGRTSVFLSDRAWRSLESEVAFLRSSVATEALAATGPSSDIRKKIGASALIDDNVSATTGTSHSYDRIAKPDGGMFLRDDTSALEGSDHDSDSQITTAKNISMYNNRADDVKGVDTPSLSPNTLTERDTYNISRSPTSKRKLWLCISYSLTFCCIPICLKSCCGLRRKEVQVAWREKITFNILVYILTFAVLFMIIGFSLFVCPRSEVLTVAEVTEKSSDDSPLMYAYGRVFSVARLRKAHESYTPKNISRSFSSWEGLDVTPLFTVTANQATFNRYCPGYELPEDDWLNYDRSTFKPGNSGKMFLHNYVDDDGVREPTVRPYLETLITEYSEYRLAWTKDAIKSKREERSGVEPSWIMLHGNVYDISTYWLSPFFNNPTVEDIFKTGMSRSVDISEPWNNNNGASKAEKAQILECMNNIFYRGIVDPRDNIKCRITKYILITVTGVAVGVIGIKYISAFRFYSHRYPEKQEKFVICLLPCYTEGYESLSASIRSIALSNYDDRFKLMLIVCDGQVIGRGNDKTTAEIVLDILKTPTSEQEPPEPLAFKSIGAGALQNNFARVYSGIYEDSGHLVPYIVIAKVGSVSEHFRPGNRGKRDSHIILMKYLNRVHLNTEMNPLELEMYRLMTEVIGINPIFYEYVLMIDADTVVYPDAINRLVSRMALDSKIVGLCGETEVQNSKDNWITMIQVYEYYISHTISKSFESLFGTVTCLPGCFSMYRIRSLSRNTPFLCSTDILNDYSENLLNTIHLKNLMMLGEDRYLTTLMIKHFPRYKTSYTPDAKCKTKVPDSFNVLVSQRRRWINSTIHNLIELLHLQMLCGTCFFSMRFIVFIDMLSTFVQPAAVIYIGYLIYLLATQPDFSVMVSILMIGCIYGLQALLAILNMRWEYILWLIIHIIAIPYFSFWIPIYSFWNVDDISWGKTRALRETKDKFSVRPEDRDFNPTLVPLKKAPNYYNPLAPERIESSQYNVGARTSGDEGSMRNSPYHLSNTPHERTHTPSLQSSHIESIHHFEDPGLHNKNKGSYQSFAAAFHYGNDPPNTRSGLFGPQAASIRDHHHPTNEELTSQIRYIILNNDLMTLTKKRIREELSRTYGIDFSDRRQSINRIVDELLHTKN